MRGPNTKFPCNLLINTFGISQMLADEFHPGPQDVLLHTRQHLYCFTRWIIALGIDLPALRGYR